MINRNISIFAVQNEISNIMKYKEFHRKIVEVKKNHVVLEGGMSMPIGDNYKDTFMSYLNSRILTK